MKLFAIPNWFTLGNLFCGCLGIVKCFEGDLVWAAYLVGIAAVLDFLDGFMARLFKVSSPVGKELDSLADMVTFGVLPGVIVFHLLIFFIQLIGIAGIGTAAASGNFGSIWATANGTTSGWFAIMPYFAFVITLFSALRLAKFNVDTRQSDSFIGLPTPANTILIAAIPLMIASTYGIDNFSSLTFRPGSFFDADYIAIASPLNDPDAAASSIGRLTGMIYIAPWILLGLSALVSYLLISEIPLFALKFKKFGWKGNEIRYIFLLLSVLLFVFFWYLGIALIIVLYVLMSVVNNLLKKKEPQA